MKGYHRLCMVSDFFYPNFGGIEEHIFNLSQCLLERGHKVVVVTHHYGERKGVRWMSNGLKVYYVPGQVFYNGAILPNLITLLPILREILIRERIEIVHCHGAFSSLAHDGLFAGKLLGLKTVFTDHSLFGFADASAVITNRFLEITLSDVDHCICVSKIGRDNTKLRANVRNVAISVIPNAVDTANFTPLDPGEKQHDDRIIIVILSRLVYRKGVDLMAGIIPAILEKYEDVDFLIGGDGPKRLLLEEIRENYGDRVLLKGAVEHALVRDFLVKGHIFLNTSLTEAFCMAIVEAAACGLQVVSTKVGGIPEVLPPSLLSLAQPTVKDLVKKLDEAIEARRNKTFTPASVAHNEVKSRYKWREVSHRTELIYDVVSRQKKSTDTERMKTYLQLGCLVGPLFCLMLSLARIILFFCEYFVPLEIIDAARDLRFKPVTANENECREERIRNAYHFS